MQAHTLIEKRNFTQISNNLINDNNISSCAFWVISYALSKPKFWKFNAKNIRKQKGWSREKLAKVLKECEDNRYLFKRKISLGKAKGFRTFWIWSEKKMDEKYLELLKNKSNNELLEIMNEIEKIKQSEIKLKEINKITTNTYEEDNNDELDELDDVEEINSYFQNEELKKENIENSSDYIDNSPEHSDDFDDSPERLYQSIDRSDEYPDVGTEEEKESKPYCKHQIDTFINFHIKQEDKKYAEVLRNWCYYKIEKGQIFNSYPNIAKELKDIIELSGSSLFEAEYLVWWNMNKNYLKLYKASKDEVSLNSYRNRNSKKEEIFKQVNSKVNSKVLSTEEEIERKTDTYDINKKPYKNIEDPVLKEFDDKLWMNFGKFTYLNWFDNTKLKIKNDTIEIHCGNRFVCDEIEKKYMRDTNYGSKGVRQGIETIAKNLNERPIKKVNVVFDFDLRFMWEDKKN